MDLGSISERKDGLEPDPEPADRRQGLGTLCDSADATNVILIKRYTKVRYAQAVRVKLERDGSRSLPVRPPSERVFGILEQLVDKMRPLTIPVGEELPPDPIDVCFRIGLGFPGVSRRSRRPWSIGTHTPSGSPRPHTVNRSSFPNSSYTGLLPE